MTPENFHHLQALMVSRSGYLLRADRKHLAEHRLAPVARREGLASVDALLDRVRDQAPGALGWTVIETMLNPETWFMRDRAPFTVYGREVLPAIARARPGGVMRVWSAGCGSGQEAWSLAMPALENGHRVEITATDLSQTMLEKARLGAYTRFEAQRGLGVRRLLRWFTQGEQMWRVNDELRTTVSFERANLLDEPIRAEGAADGRFDIIFCRYVLDEMEPSRRARTIDMLEAALADDGCLFLGLGDTLSERPDSFRPVPGRPGLYVKAPAALKRAA